MLAELAQGPITLSAAKPFNDPLTVSSVPAVGNPVVAREFGSDAGIGELECHDGPALSQFYERLGLKEAADGEVTFLQQ